MLSLAASHSRSVQLKTLHVWLVEEEFVDVIAFEAHQARVAASEWGRMTTGIERRYVVEGLADA